ncbi:tetraacyldisaccharide 4'-kinase [Pyxidicoccus fallax]|uniref:tetraacyldisaccharide 4'-kinase n=2 Tax=Pyxidicoccus fallax TaxID=394095 RepID=UPI003459129E
MSPPSPSAPTTIERVFYPSEPEPWGRRALLSPLTAVSWTYGAAVRLRGALYDVGLLRAERVEGLRVISVGNVNVGGTGKTPAVLHLAELLVREGRKVGILTRGYGRRSKEPLTFIGTEPLPSVEEAGDEPLLLARRCPEVRLFVGADRVAGAYRARDEFGLDTVLLDDGFQHRRLARDEDLVVVDESVGLGNGHMLPRGPLREPRSALRRATLFWIRVAATPSGTAGMPRSLQAASSRAGAEGTFVPRESSASWGHVPHHGSRAGGAPIAEEGTFVPREPSASEGHRPPRASGAGRLPTDAEGTFVPRESSASEGQLPHHGAGAGDALTAAEGTFVPRESAIAGGAMRPLASEVTGALAPADVPSHSLDPAVPRVRTRYRPIGWVGPSGELLPVDALAGQPVLALAGLARPGGFLRTLHSLGAEVRDAALFPDHHRFTAEELRDVEARAVRQGIRVVTTEKDLVRLPPGFVAWVVRLGVEVLEGESHLRRALGLADASRDL